MFLLFALVFVLGLGLSLVDAVLRLFGFHPRQRTTHAWDSRSDEPYISSAPANDEPREHAGPIADDEGEYVDFEEV